ncbi:3-oxoacyl-ACP reductase FabG [Zavarzinia compransoris]|uniref:3-oxoacyl-ACP reductase FabG n=1 Tax=Zavarzinia marina TaxID=2911065 RepID=UPI001EEEAFF8|nr:3-oxoacyl-ACP reductase FabG [Zavarzinia marina]MCF4166262.1 3-oxoacyl-ACP reductase FabG [Zavarzinia marina]
MLTPMTGRSVIVTGASKGIGRGIALRFGEVGAKVLVVSRRLEDAAKVADEITAAGGIALPFAADVGREADARAMADAAVAAHGGIDVLCANAGIYPTTPLAEMTMDDYGRVMDTNVKGTFLSVIACLPALKAKRKGRIVLTSSITGPITGVPYMTHYAASKSAQLGFMRAAALELAPWRITVNAVLPGNIMTEGLAGLGADHVATMEASVPLRRLGTVFDIANAVLYFASDEAAYVTAQSLVVDGGQILPEGGMMAPEVEEAG